jgi:hypothetical protein
MQPCPDDNTTEYVERQIKEWRTSGQLIHTEVAREIAAWWQAPTGYGVDFAAFQSTGTITDDLNDGIYAETLTYVGLLQLQSDPDYRLAREVTVAEYLDNADALNALHALDAYVMATSVTPWIVGHNMAGYSPECDIYSTLDYESAYASFVDELDRLADDFAEMTADHAEDCDCEDCSTRNFATADHEAYKAVWRPEPQELSEGYQISGHRVDVYWLSLGEPMTYAEYLEGKEN